MENNENKVPVNNKPRKRPTLMWGLGYLFGCVLSVCLATTVIAFLLAITIKAIAGLWLWVF